MLSKLSGAKAEIYYPLISLLLDAAAVVFSFVLSFWLRFFSPLTLIIPVTQGIPPLDRYLIFSIVAVMIYCSVFAVRGLYRLHDRVSTIDEFIRVLQATLLAIPWLFTIAFFYRDFSYSRLVFLLIIITSVLILTFERALIQSWMRKLYRRGVGVLKTAVFGTGDLASRIHNRLKDNPHLGYYNVGYIHLGQTTENLQPIIGSIAEIDEIVKRHELNMVFIALGPDDQQRIGQIIRRCDGINLDFLLAPDQVVLEGKVQPFWIAGLPLLKIKEFPLFGWKGVIKRGFDLLVSVIILLLCSPIIALISILVKLTSAGPVFYHQERIGLDGRTFYIHKFRTMVEEAEEKTGPVWAKKGDNRTTKVGQFLRKFSLDELPQIFNVLRGDMSIVGPRPERPYFVAQFRQEVPHYLERHRVRSGITGWAQVNGLRGDTSIELRTQYDIYYVENWSLAFDLRIMLMTIKEIFFGRHAY